MFEQIRQLFFKRSIKQPTVVPEAGEPHPQSGTLPTRQKLDAPHHQQEPAPQTMVLSHPSRAATAIEHTTPHCDCPDW
jgi:hypothetical protein